MGGDTPSCCYADEIAAAGLAGATVLEVGGDVGEISVDLAVDPPRADIVVLHRVICCYPGCQEMVGARNERLRAGDWLRGARS